MSDTIPFTKRERRSLCYQWGYGRRPTNNWGSGNLPAPYAEGDVVEYLGGAGDRMYDWPEGFYVVASGFSIGEGDDWYFRVSNLDVDRNSDRLHVFAGGVDYMGYFRLVDTSDPEGLAKRERLLAEGWSPPVCGVDTYCSCACHGVSGFPEQGDDDGSE